MLITKYLIFDLEYAASRKGTYRICEFGYVLTNDKFEILKQGNFIIDPFINRSDWDWYAVKNILTRKVSYYEKQPKFDEFYDDICELINESDYVFGHSLNGDAKALNDECERYNLKSIDFEFYDIKKFYSEYANIQRDVSVTEMLEKLGIKGDDRAHDAEADAYNTMLELKTMVETLKLSIDELITICPNAKDINKDYNVESLVISQMIKEEEFNKLLSTEGDNTLKRNRHSGRIFLQFLDNVLPTKELEKKLDGLKFSISINYEENHYRQMLNIVQILTNLGAKYVMKASQSNIFVAYEALNEDGTVKDCSKLRYVTKANQEGSNIRIISFNEFLEMLNITEDELNNLPLVSFDCLYREDAVIKDRKTLLALNKKPKPMPNRVDDTLGTLGDICKDFFAEYLKDNK